MNSTTMVPCKDVSWTKLAFERHPLLGGQFNCQSPEIVNETLLVCNLV